MEIHEFVDEGLGHSSYLVDLGDGTAAVVDPPRFPTAHEALAERLGATDRVDDRHPLARRLRHRQPCARRRSGATFVAPAASHLADTASAGRTTASGSSSLTASSWSRSRRPATHPTTTPTSSIDDGSPAGVVLRRSLMVGAVGRTDLCGPELAEPLAHDDVPLAAPTRSCCPTISPCIRPMAPGRSAPRPAARERTTHARPRTGHQPAVRDRRRGRLRRAAARRVRDVPHLLRSPARAEPARPTPLRRGSPNSTASTSTTSNGTLAAGARRRRCPTDRRVRPPVTCPGRSRTRCDRCSPAGSAGSSTSTEPLVFVLDADQDRAELVRQCLDVGHEQPRRRARRRHRRLASRGRPISTIPLVDPAAMRRHGDRCPPGQRVRHRPRPRRASTSNSAAIGNSAVPDGPLTVMCGHGERAMTAASILTGRGRRDVIVLDGGPDTWAASTGQPLAESDR